MMREPARPRARTQPRPAVVEPAVKFRAAKHTVVVKEVFDIASVEPATYLIRFTVENGSFEFQPGQFISIFAEKEGKKISRPYSIASPPDNREYLELCIKVVEGGFMSNYLHHIVPGTKLSVIGPLGRFILIEPPPADIVFVSTGTGIAPLIGMTEHIFARGYDVNVEMVFGVRYKHDLIYMDRMERWEKEHPNFHLYVTISRPQGSDWTGRSGYVQKIIEGEISDREGKDVYICGLHNMVEDAKLLCESLDFRTVRFEKWD